MRVQASGNLFPAYQKRGEPDRRQMADMLIMHAVEALIIMPATRESSEDLREGLEAFGAKRKRDFAEMMPGEAIRGRWGVSPLTGDREFESISLQERVSELSVPLARDRRWRTQVNTFTGERQSITLSPRTTLRASSTLSRRAQAQSQPV